MCITSNDCIFNSLYLLANNKKFENICGFSRLFAFFVSCGWPSSADTCARLTKTRENQTDFQITKTKMPFICSPYYPENTFNVWLQHIAYTNIQMEIHPEKDQIEITPCCTERIQNKRKGKEGPCEKLMETHEKKSHRERKTSEMICGLLFKSRKFSCVTQAIRVRFISIFFLLFRAFCLCLDEKRCVLRECV